MVIFTLGAGMASPIAFARALGVHPDLTGSAAGVYGFTQMMVGSLCTLAAGLGHQPALSAALTLAAACVVGRIGFKCGTRSSELSK